MFRHGAWLFPLRALLAVLPLVLLGAAASAQAQTVTPAAAPAAPLAPAAPAAPAAAPAGTGLKLEGERLQVTAPFIEFHTGPGRGFPVFFVVERRGWITIELRRTDWYRVRAESGQVGWVQRKQLESTITEAGGTRTFRDTLIDDYLARRLEFGGGWGRFEKEPMLKLWTTYRLADTLGVEATIGQVQGVFSGTDFWHVALVSEPWSDKRFSPYIAVGLGQFANVPNSSLVDARRTDANLGYAGAGVRWYLSDRFVARLDWSLYAAFVSDTRTLEYRALTLGISFFF